MALAIETLDSPLCFLRHMLGRLPHEAALREYESWWATEGRGISDSTDRAGTPWLRMYDRAGQRVDEILFAPEYWRCLRKGYQTGVVWRAFEEESLVTCALLDYITCYYDPGLTCPYVVSLATAVAIDRHGDEALKARFLPHLLRKDDSVEIDSEGSGGPFPVGDDPLGLVAHVQPQVQRVVGAL